MPPRVYKTVGIKKNSKKFLIEAPIFNKPKQQEAELEAVFEEEDEAFKEQKQKLVEEIEKLRTSAEKEILVKEKASESKNKKILEMAEVGAFKRIKSANEEYNKTLDTAAKEAEDIVRKAQLEAQEIVKKAEDGKEALMKEAEKIASEKAYDEAFGSYRPEIEKSIDRLNQVLTETINKRNEIIESSEKQLSDIAILIARKVVKSISETHQSVIIRNVSEALRKIKGKTRVTIRINISDLELITRHKDEYYKMLANIEEINILEDPNIEKGGCVVETDFGEVDARISAQLEEVESAVKKVQPIKDF